MAAGIIDIEAPEAGIPVDNAYFESIGLTDEWIKRRSGISTRRWLTARTPLAEVAADACRPLVSRHGDPSTVDALIVVSTSVRQRVPGIAQQVATAAGLPASVLAFDMNAACCGFVYALTTGLSLCDAGRARSVVVCSAEAMSTMVDKTDRQTACIFADGVAAVLLGAREEFAPATHLAGSDGTQKALMCETDGGGIHLEGAAVYDRAVRRMTETAERLCAWDPRPSVLVGHQANGRILEQVRAFTAPLDVPFINRIEHLGNTSSASIPLAFGSALRDASVPPRGRLGAVAYGAGEAWGGVSVSYGIG
ncbi:3-oxoacyl-ACP synthase III family protein [Streptomyces seoulensis]